MKFTETAVSGAYLIDLEPFEDERGFLAETFVAAEFERRGLDPTVRQCNLSFNRQKGTLRGLHYQGAPMEEAKLVRCIRGRIWDVVLDVRPGSPTKDAHFGTELSAQNRSALFVPAGCAHGFQTLVDESEAFYLISQVYSPEHSRGLRYDDPAFGISWPLPVTVISDRDAGWPLLRA